MKKLLCFIAALSVSNQLVAESSQMVIGGTPAAEGMWPWMASLHSKGTNTSLVDRHFCGATLIDKRWLMTAAHCLEYLTEQSIEVRIGGIDRSKPLQSGVAAEVDRILIHPGYEEHAPLDNDIALLHLTSDVDGEYLASSAVLQSPFVIPLFTQVTTMGWGLTEANAETASPVLMQAEVDVISDAVCRLVYDDPELPRITENMLCAGVFAGGKDSCKGDSGGPLVVQLNQQWYQLGIVSWGAEQCGAADHFGVYTKVSRYTQWLSRHKRQLSQDTYVDVGAIPLGYEVVETLNISNNSQSAQTVTSMEVNGNRLTLANNRCVNQGLGSKQQCSFDVRIKSDTEGAIDSKIVSVATDSQDSLETRVKAHVLPSVALNNTVSNQSLSFYSNSDLPWSDQAAVPGTVRSGTFTQDSSVSALLTLVKGPATLTFQWKHSEQSNTDSFDSVVMVDGKMVASMQPDQASWVEQQLTIAEGEHRIVWASKQYYSDSVPAAHLMLRNVTVQTSDPATPVTPTTPSPSSPASKSGSGGGGGSLGGMVFIISGMLGAARLRRRQCRVTA